MTSTRAKWGWGRKAIVGVAAITSIVGIVMFGGGALMDGHIDLGIEKQLKSSPSWLYPFLDNAPGIDAWWSVGQEGQPDQVPRMSVRRKSGPESGAGLQVEFVVADGGGVMETWTIKSVKPPSEIVYEVDFAGAMKVERTLTLTPDGDGTKVTWRETGNIERPAMRWMKMVMPPEEIQANFDRALAALDKAAQNRRAAAPTQ